MLIALAALLAAAREKPIVVADGGRPAYTICISHEASPSRHRTATGLHRQAPLKLVNGFEKGDVACRSINWSARGDDRANLVLGSPQRTLAPGESFLFRTEYRIEH